MGKIETETPGPGLIWLYKTGGTASMIAGVLFLLASIDLLTVVLQPGATNGWLSPFQNNWLIVIFKLHAGFSGVQLNQLHILNFLDIALLALVGATVFGLYVALRKTDKVWSLIALVQPFMGIMLFIGTQNAGRSAVMGAVLVISAVTQRNRSFNRMTAYMGILAAVLLLAGDFSAGLLPPTMMIAALFGFGYLLLMTWYFLIAAKLFQLRRSG